LNEIDRSHTLSPTSELLMRAARTALGGSPLDDSAQPASVPTAHRALRH
jgi:hypothetical protein